MPRWRRREQLGPQPVLQQGDVAADGALGDQKLTRRVGEVQVAAGGFEGADGGEGREFAGHDQT